MKIRTIIFIVLALALLGGVGFAQNPKETPKKEESIEDLYLSNPGLQIAYEAARANERDSKLLAISQINELLDKGLGADDEAKITVVLRDLSAQGTTVRILEKGRVINYFVDVRIEACRVLAAVKSQDAKKKAAAVLIEVLQKDDDPIVKSSAAYSLGLLGVNENGESSRAIARALEIQDYVAPNDNFAFSGCIALERISKANKGIGDSSSLRILVKIAQGNYTQTVKKRALEVIQTLRTGSH